MILEIKLSDEQLGELADIVAAKLERKDRSAYTVKEAAAKLQISPKTILRRIEAKIIPVVPGIGAKRIPASWLDQQVNPTPAT
jgi:hypothetical protein